MKEKRRINGAMNLSFVGLVIVALMTAPVCASAATTELLGKKTSSARSGRKLLSRRAATNEVTTLSVETLTCTQSGKKDSAKKVYDWKEGKTNQISCPVNCDLPSGEAIEGCAYNNGTTPT